ANPRAVPVEADGVAETRFDVTCAAAAGTVRVTTDSWGLGIDPDGYVLAVDGAGATAIGSSATVDLAAVPAGDRSISLSGLAGNCSVQGPNPVQVTVPDGGTVDAAFAVFCFQALVNQIAFESRRDPEPGDIYVMNADGSGVKRLTRHPGLDREPDVAPDGSAIVFESDREGSRNIWIMDAAGIRNLTTSLATHRSPVFSPDGSQVAYSRHTSLSDRIYTIGRWGGSATSITDDAADDDQPAWSPDGTMILFRRYPFGTDGGDLYVVDANGANLTQLTTDLGTDGKPAWSSDGTRITWSSDRDGTFDIWRADFDRNSRTLSNLVNLTPGSPGTDGKSDWHPSLQRIAYATDNDGDNEIVVMNADGSGKTVLTSNGYDDREPSWSP
ncbi:MAG: hypothetical protein R6X22_12315, partial [Gemmatimonadota bacterium]